MQNLYFQFLSQCHSVDGCRKNDEKITPYCHLLYAKSQICIGIAKIEKLKTQPLSKFILDQGYVLGNANFDPGKQICDFASSQSFFLRLKMTIVLAKITAITVIKNHSQGIHEVEWHQYDLRKELCAYGGIGSPILRKSDLFLYKTRKCQNHFVNLILGYYSPYGVFK